MSSDQGLISKSLEEMQMEIDQLLGEAAKLKEEHDRALNRSKELRTESVESRIVDPKLSEMLWEEAERLLGESKELMRQAVEKRLQAGEVQHRQDIRAQIEAIDSSEEAWRRAARARRG